MICGVASWENSGKRLNPFRIDRAKMAYIIGNIRKRMLLCKSGNAMSAVCDFFLNVKLTGLSNSCKNDLSAIFSSATKTRHIRRIPVVHGDWFELMGFGVMFLTGSRIRVMNFSCGKASSLINRVSMGFCKVFGAIPESG